MDISTSIEIGTETKSSIAQEGTFHIKRTRLGSLGKLGISSARKCSNGDVVFLSREVAQELRLKVDVGSNHLYFL